MNKSTEQLKTQLIEDIQEEVNLLAMECKYNKDDSRIVNVLEIADSALSQMEIATQELKKGETKRIAYQQGYREAREGILVDLKSMGSCSVQNDSLCSAHRIHNPIEFLESLKHESQQLTRKGEK